jgi:hypothetical protein
MRVSGFLLMLFLLFAAAESRAFDWDVDGRFKGAGRFTFQPPPGSDVHSGVEELRLGAHGNVFRRDEWSLDYEVAGDLIYADGAAAQSGLMDRLDADFFRAWARFGDERRYLRGGRQEILFGAAAIFRPLGLFDTRVVSAIIPETRGVDGALGSWFFDKTESVHAWAVPARNGDRVIVGGRWEGMAAGHEVGLVFQYHPRSDLDALANFDLETTQAGFHFKGERVVGYWSEGRLDIEAGEGALRFEGTIGADYTLGIGGGLHVLAEYFLSARRRDFTPPDPPRGDRTFHQLGISLDQPVGIAVVWRLFGFYDVADESFQLVPQIEYAFTDNAYVYLHGNWGGGLDGGNGLGRFYRKTPAFNGTESAVGITLAAYF